MEIIIKFLQITLLIFSINAIHQLGHFVAAKIFNVKIEKVFIFNSPWFSFFKFNYGKTEYGLGWIPWNVALKIPGMKFKTEYSLVWVQLGAHVKLPYIKIKIEDKKILTKDPEPEEFISKPSWQRLIVMLSGSFMNIFIAFFIFVFVVSISEFTYVSNSSLKYGIQVDSLGQTIGLRNGDKIISIDNRIVDDLSKIPHKIFMYNIKNIQIDRVGEKLEIYITDDFKNSLYKAKRKQFIIPRMPLRINSFTDSSKALDAGLKKGDWVQSINGKEIIFFDQFQIFRDSVAANKNEDVIVTVERNGQIFDVYVPVPVQDDGLIGISVAGDPKKDFEFKTIKYTISQAFSEAFRRIIDVAYGLKSLIISLFDPGRQMYMEFFEGLLSDFDDLFNFRIIPNWKMFLNFIAIFSLARGFFSLLPIPPINDGAYSLYIIYEMLTGTKVSYSFIKYTHYITLFFIIALLVIGNILDIFKYLL